MSLNLPNRLNPKFNSISEFIIKKEIGSGAFSTVLKVEHKFNKNFYALKRLNLKTINSLHLENLYKEILIHRELENLHIVGYHDFFKEDHFIYLVLEYCSGGNLFNYLVKKQELRTKEIKNIFYQTIMGINHMHEKKILMRDLKPENILLSEDKTIKICDFGWSSKTDDYGWLNKRAGTFAYMAPESLKGENQTFKTDIWALGILLYELYYNKEPFPGQSCRTQLFHITNFPINFSKRNIPQQAKDLIISILRYDPKNRPDLYFIINHPFLNEIHTNYNKLSKVNKFLLKDKNLEKNYHSLSKINYKNDRSSNNSMKINYNSNFNIKMSEEVKNLENNYLKIKKYNSFENDYPKKTKISLTPSTNQAKKYIKRRNISQKNNHKIEFKNFQTKIFLYENSSKNILSERNSSNNLYINLKKKNIIKNIFDKNNNKNHLRHRINNSPNKNYSLNNNFNKNQKFINNNCQNEYKNHNKIDINYKSILEKKNLNQSKEIKKELIFEKNIKKRNLISLNDLRRNLSLDYQKHKNNNINESNIYTPRIYNNKSNSNSFILKKNNLSEKNLFNQSIKPKILNSKIKFELNKNIFMKNFNNFNNKSNCSLNNFKSYFKENNLEKQNIIDDKKVYSSRNINIKNKILDSNNMFDSLNKNNIVITNLVNKNNKRKTKNKINDYIEKIDTKANLEKKINSNLLKKTVFTKKRKTKKRDNLLKYIFKKKIKIKNNLEREDKKKKIENIPKNKKKKGNIHRKNILSFNLINKDYNIYQKFFEKKTQFKNQTNEKRKTKAVYQTKKIYNEKSKLYNRYKLKKESKVDQKKNYSSSLIAKNHFNLLNSPNLLNKKFIYLKDKKKINYLKLFSKKNGISGRNFKN